MGSTQERERKSDSNGIDWFCDRCGVGPYGLRQQVCPNCGDEAGEIKESIIAPQDSKAFVQSPLLQYPIRPKNTYHKFSSRLGTTQAAFHGLASI